MIYCPTQAQSPALRGLRNRRGPTGGTRRLNRQGRPWVTGGTERLNIQGSPWVTGGTGRLNRVETMGNRGNKKAKQTSGSGIIEETR